MILRCLSLAFLTVLATPAAQAQPGLHHSSAQAASHVVAARKLEGPVILTISGRIAPADHSDKVEFDLTALKALGVTRLVTSTPWTEGTLEIEGVLLKTLLEHVGATGDLIFAEAFNDYNSEIPISDATEGGAVIAYQIDGKEMSVRDKGPLWLVYPYDSDPTYRSEVYFARSIWQLDRLTLRDKVAGWAP